MLALVERSEETYSGGLIGVDLHETIDLLNELIRTLGDDQENFPKAVEHVASGDLKVERKWLRRGANWLTCKHESGQEKVSALEVGQTWSDAGGPR